jgi:hypothetical protein
MRKLAALALLASACSNNDNTIIGGIASGATTPDVIFDNIGSTIHGVATLRDADGNPVGDPMWVVIMSDLPGLCSTLHQHRDFFRNAPGAYESLVLMTPAAYLGTFIIGRDGVDITTAAEIVAASGPQVTTPFHGLNGGYVSITGFDPNGGEASGNFNILFDDPYGNPAHPFYGHFKTGFCPDLEGTLLP